MPNEGMDRCYHEQLLSKINQETGSTDRKLDHLTISRGFFTPIQVARVLYAIPGSVYKIQAIDIMGSRLCRMTCSEARDILGAVPLNNDKIYVLSVIKRALVDSQSRDGMDLITSCFPFDEHKRAALNILKTVRSDIEDSPSAGAHQIYASMGGILSQSRPCLPNLYGDEYTQALNTAGSGKGKIVVIKQAQESILPSKYSGHPSYAYPQGRDYAQDRQYPGCGAYGEQNQSLTDKKECPGRTPLFAHYPSGAPPLNAFYSVGTTAPTSYQTATSYE